MVRAQSKLAVAQSGFSDARRQLRERAINAYIRQPSAQAVDLLLRVRTFRQPGAGSSFVSSVVRDQANVVSSSKVSARKPRRSRRRSRRSATLPAISAMWSPSSVTPRQRPCRPGSRPGQRRGRGLWSGERPQRSSPPEVEFEAQLRRCSALNSIGNLLRNSQRGQVFTGSGKARWFPLANARLTSSSGTDAPNVQGSSADSGADFGAPSGTPTWPAGPAPLSTPGRAVATACRDHRSRPGAGRVVADQSAVLRGHGCQGDEGPVIGRVGSTGMSTGRHLTSRSASKATPSTRCRICSSVVRSSSFVARDVASARGAVIGGCPRAGVARREAIDDTGLLPADVD